ncbi:MAG: ankyrin repeat domain-containing protein, partial [Gammaproteobacteria bacterium]|nr:ankyrin repeat domain-containing protein [Gammaproteobacteria bacterium]NNJ85456.1 ankryin [Gammaproteobacteria bacterium]
ATPLIISIARRHDPVTRLLLTKGANPNAFDRDGQTALSEASAVGDEDTVDLLLRYGADPTQHFGKMK